METDVQMTNHRAQILQKARDLVAMIQSTELYARFKQAEYKLEKHPDGQVLLFLAKAKRNAYSQISLRHGYEHPATVKAKQEYDEVLQQIEQIPLIEEYQTSQEDLNELLQGVTHTIIGALTPDIKTEVYEEESGGGCATGACGSCKAH